VIVTFSILPIASISSIGLKCGFQEGT
jgi:hypothetical protein